MSKYELTVSDIEIGIKRFLAEAYATATVSEKPELIFISAGPGAGKTTLETFFKKRFKDRGERIFEVSSDKIAMYHPQYEEAIEELPDVCYNITRQFVRPATPKIMNELMEHNISILNEKTFNKGTADVEQIKEFKKNGYKIVSNILATDIFESRLSCFEREARMLMSGLTPRGCSKENQLRMYNSFIRGIHELENNDLLDELNVFIRGENINKPPILKYSKDSKQYANFEEALNTERMIQRKKILSNPSRIFFKNRKC